ncbi:hypothetical protein [Deinococcus soli (ex Cha et al. 2016)]|uniref:Uncharacterized protein n=2 Tax=Deinococcus soli (ex Cha et al. 2016) TaxID=1309411 RepID=A0ACC6KH22_9DEIO|nr:hypothetical protein [Deinococcus soli (ex Cha et al. 2016)]MDR6218849.1 hypothetical protein [Deinococcus soli (ex Cha et al. 2016)]MDR6328646.1 hypothetical protein [Deinococcus soli (ex Cha et al. 2016)]MDR6751867.1 hypothetical protein [Deinococcus soli (ex Cha et al. 2016)]
MLHDVKAQAKRARAILEEEHGVTFSHAQALHFIARTLGYSSAQAMKRDHSRTATPRLGYPLTLLLEYRGEDHEDHTAQWTLTLASEADRAAAAQAYAALRDHHRIPAANCFTLNSRAVVMEDHQTFDQPGDVRGHFYDLTARIDLHDPERPSLGALSVTRGSYRVDLEDTGEGRDGAHDPEDPTDQAFLRFTVSECQGGEWQELEGTSYCTRIPVTVEERRARELAEYILSEIIDAARGGLSVKKTCEALSWLTGND